ncbi:nicotinate-nucleotide--dimethylbenzimidazole phosphoribosyltransferase [Streptomyces sp. NPDC055749]
MTDTGQIPGEGLPENAGMVEQPGVPAPDAYTFLDPSEHAPEDDDLLLMPTSQGAWSDPQAAPAEPAAYAPAPEQATYQPQYAQAPAPAHGHSYGGQVQAAQAEQTAGTHESGGRDTGSVDLNGVRIPAPAQAPVQAQAPAPVAVGAQTATVTATAPTRRPLHRGPASTEAPSFGGTPSGGVVRSLADRGPTAAPQTPPPARHAGPPTTGPEYFDVPAEGPAPLPAAQLSEIPPQAQAPAPWIPEAPQPEQAAPAETVVPEPVAEAPVEVPAELPVESAAEAIAEPVAPTTPAPVPTPVLESDTLGRFVAVEGFVPTPPHLAPTPVAEQPAPPEPVPATPAPQPQPESVAVAPEPVPVPVPVPEPAPVAAEAEAAIAEPEQEAAPEVTAPPEPVVEAAPAPAAPAEPVATVEPEPVTGPEIIETPEIAEPAQTAVAAAAPAAPPAEIPTEAPAEEPTPLAAEAPQPTATPAAPEPSATVPAPEPSATPAEPQPVAETPAPQPLAETPAPQPVEESPAPQPPATASVPEPTETASAPQPLDDAAAPQPLAETPAPQPLDEAAAPQLPEETAAPAAVSPPAPGYDDAEREAVLRVMRERRDIRNGFRSDPIPHEVLLRVLEAAHTAPSVGHSQPWDFVVIRSAETRRSMHELAQRQRDAYANSLPKGRAKQFKELKIEAILDTPVNIVVTADPTRGGRHTLGRHTQPQMAPYSSALAVENLWLAARAEGLGVGWVSFFDEREMVRALGLPDHLEVVAYLCVGYVDEFPEEPELMQAGWSKRRPLSWVVHEETYGRRALPGEEPHDLLQETISNIRPLDAKALGEAWERQKRMTKPAGALGMLEIISAQLSGLSRMCPPPIPEPAAVAIFAGDHGVHAQGVTAWPQEVTAQMVANFLGGGAVCNAFAAQVGAEVCVVDVGVASDLPATPGLLPRKVRAGTADFTTGPALSREEVLAAIEVGIETARDLVAAGNKGLLTGEMGIANTTASAALICVYTGIDPAEVTGRGTGINDEMHARKVDVVRRALDLHQPDPSDPIGVLAAVGGLEHAAMAGFLLGGASLRTPVILDGVSAGAAALVARAIAPEALAACIAGHRSAEPGHIAALNKLGLRPLVDLDLRLGEGTGALLALPIVQSAARAMHEVATFDSAGVTEK